MDRLLYARASRPAIPFAWGAFVKIMCECEDFKLQRLLWKQLYASEYIPILGVCARLGKGHDTSALVQELTRAIPPRLLLTLCERLAPETCAIPRCGRSSGPSWSAVDHQVRTGGGSGEGTGYNLRKKQGKRNDLTSHQNDGRLEHTAQAVAKEFGVGAGNQASTLPHHTLR
jgi:hypothetical protein